MQPTAKGYVISVHRKYFWCRFDYKEKSFDAEIAIAQLSKRERPFLEEGAYIFFLKGGSLRFNRTKWTKKEIEKAKKSAEVLWSKLFSS